MPRRRLTFEKGGYYHIYNRGADRRSIFRSEEDYLLALRLMKRYSDLLSVTVIAYCMLPNHYHWLVRQDGESPAGQLPQRVFNAYAKAFNNARGRTGTLFEGRYKAVLVASEGYQRHLCCYIHANPVRHGVANGPELWPYSNYLDWMGQRQGSLFDRQFVETQFGSAKRYQARLRSYLISRVRLPSGLQCHLDNL